MKKHILTRIGVSLSIVFAFCFSAYALTNNTTTEVVKTYQKDNVVYTVHATSAAGVSRQKDSGISLNMKIVSDDKIEIATRPVVATDEKMNSIVEITDISLEDNCLSFETPCQSMPEKLYVQTPFVTRISECNIAVTEIAGISTENRLNIQPANNLFIVYFDSNTFEVIPNKVEFEYGEYTRSTSPSTVFFIGLTARHGSRSCLPFWRFPASFP